MITEKEIVDYLEEENMVLCKDNIIRRRSDGHPACPNAIFQPLLEMKQDEVVFTSLQEKIYAACYLSLAEIVLNNRHYKFQTPEIKEECRGEALYAIEGSEKCFDRNKGKAYSYAFRCMYTNMVHVLERHNTEREMMEKLRESYEEMLSLENSGKKISNINTANL